MARVLGIGRALRVEHFGRGKLLDDAVERKDGIFRDGVVVALDGGELGGIGADDGDGLEL